MDWRFSDLCLTIRCASSRPAKKKTTSRHDPRIAITAVAYETIAATLPPGGVGYNAKPTDPGDYLIWLERRALSRLDALRQPGEGHSEVIAHLAETGASRRRRSPSRLRPNGDGR